MLHLALLALFAQAVLGGGTGGHGHANGSGNAFSPRGGGSGGGGHHGSGPGKPTYTTPGVSSPPVALPTPVPSNIARRRLVVFGDSLSDDGSESIESCESLPLSTRSVKFFSVDSWCLDTH